MTETISTTDGNVATTSYSDVGPVEEAASDAPSGTSYTAVRFGIGFVAGMLVAGVVGVATGAFGPAMLLGVAVGMVAGVAYAELAD
jgi:hypothetical protein